MPATEGSGGQGRQQSAQERSNRTQAWRSGNKRMGREASTVGPPVTPRNGHHQDGGLDRCAARDASIGPASTEALEERQQDGSLSSSAMVLGLQRT